MKKNMICIGCPRGCHLTAEIGAEADDIQVTGNFCGRGREYARQECLNPCRILTTVVRTDSADVPFLPVRTDAPLPKKHIADTLRQLFAMMVQLPVRRGDIIVKDVNATGVNVIAAESV